MRALLYFHEEMCEMKTKTCAQCKKEIRDEIKKEYRKDEYQWMIDLMQSAIEHTTVCAIAVMERRGRSKDYIQKFFNELCFVYDMPSIFGKEIRAEDVKRRYEKEYNIDFDKIKVHFESEKEFVKKNG